MSTKALLIKPKNEAEEKFLSGLLHKLGVPSARLDLKDIEDIGLSVLMNQSDRSKKVSRATILKKLTS